MPNAKVLDFLQNAAHPERKLKRRSGNVPLSKTHPSRSAFHGLFIAVLLAACFWATLMLLISWLR